MNYHHFTIEKYINTNGQYIKNLNLTKNDL